MALPGNGIFVVRGEMSTLMTAMRRGSRWSSTSYQDEEQDALMKQFVELKNILNQIEDIKLIDPNIFLGPFLDVIRTEETTGAITSLALSAVNKFLSYGLIDPLHSTLAATVENIADAVTHARFLGTDQSSDGVTLMRVVEVLHTLMRSPEGSALTNESVCEVMLSCFKICFEPRLNELLRRTAEQALKDMVLLLFMRLPQFADDRQQAGLLRKFKMIPGSMEQLKKRKSKILKQNHLKSDIPRISVFKNEEKPIVANQEYLNSPQIGGLNILKEPPLATTPATPIGNIVDMQGKITQTPTSAFVDVEAGTIIVSTGEESQTINAAEDQPENNDELTEKLLQGEDSLDNDADNEDEPIIDGKDEEKRANDGEYINSVGVRFTQQNSAEVDGTNPLLPYGLPCIQELFRFLILLCNPLDKQNTDTMMHMGLSLLTVALEVGADNIGKYNTLLALVKDEMCRNLFSLLNSERLTIFAADLQLCFLLFESLRSHLKFQLEFYLTKLTEIIASENPRTPYEMRELSLDNLLQLWRIPGFVAELYTNYDCNLYCSDLFENLTKLLSKNTLSATNSIYSTHILSMDILLTVIENIEKNCISLKNGNQILQQASTRHSRNNSDLERIIIEPDLNISAGESSAIENITTFMNCNKKPENQHIEIWKEKLADLKNKKRVLAQGTELFNQRPDKGILYLQENGILNSILDPMEIALFLRENPGLDKKMIGEYISKKKNVESKILENFVESFDFSNMRIDQALRIYLETFRLPGEAPLIFLVMEHFADHWHRCNNEPFANTDAAFRLAYAIIMLNMDQHNHNAKRLNVPMTPEDFLKNLRGLNGNKDFDQDMLLNVFNAIKNDEIVMPAEQTGIVRENYLWKVLLRRGIGSSYHHVQDSAHDKDLFNIVWGSTLAALSFMFDKSSENGYQKTLNGFTKCAGISAFYGLYEDFDGVILTLCKFSTLLNIQPEANEISVSVSFGANTKAQSSMKSVFSLVHEYGDCMRESWKNILEVIVQLFRLRLLPKTLIEVEDFCEPNGKAILIQEKPLQKSDAGLLSSLYSYLSSEGQRQPTYEEQEIIKIAKKCIRECQIDQIISESKFVHFESLQELIKIMLNSIKAPNAHKSVGLQYSEDIVVFLMEILVRIVIQNRDRMLPLWSSCKDNFYLLLIGGASCGYDYLLNRTTIALLKLAIYLMRNEELCPIVLQSLKMLLMLKPNVIYRISKQISIGIYELLKTSAQNIHTETDWQIIFTTLECVGAGALPPEFEEALPLIDTKSDGALSSEEDSSLPDRGYTSDSEIVNQKSENSISSTQFISPAGENWILVNKDTDLITTSRPQSPIGCSLVYPCKLMDNDPFALFKCWDSLAFIVRNVAHITPYNFESCVRCIRTFVESCLNGGIKMRQKLTTGKAHLKKKSSKKDLAKGRTKKDENSSDSDDEELIQRYETIAIQLLDLMYTLYTRTAQIFRWWAEEGAVPQCSALWAQGWCPLLQGIARLAVDRRREVRTYAISCLQQRALLVHDLQTLTGAEWASCFKQVLFPLLNELLPESSSIQHIDQHLLEESRIRTATIMSKVFLHHLTPLIELPTFNDLWIEILDYIEKFMKVGSDLLYEQMLEILKNMLLVMHSVRIFHYDDSTKHSPLWQLTWKRIGEFLPSLRDELFKEEVNYVQLSEHNQPGQQEVISPSFINIQPMSQFSGIMMSPRPPLSSSQTLLQFSTNQINGPVIDEQDKGNKLESGISSQASQSQVSSHQNLVQVPKASIILQPPIDELVNKPVILGQGTSPKHNVPILVPQANILQQNTQFSPSHIFENSASGSSLNYQYPNYSSSIAKLPEQLSSYNSQIIHSQIENKLTDSINDSSLMSSSKLNENSQIHIILPTSKNNTCEISTKTNLEFSNNIEVSDISSSKIEISNETNNLSSLQFKSGTNISDSIDEDSTKKNLNSSNEIPSPALLTDIKQSNTLNDPIMVKMKSLENSKYDEDEEHDELTIPRVPISHLIGGNQYPSLNKIPPPNIVQSFAPIYVQAQLPQSGTDIYQDYIQNPYNLTLQQYQSMNDVNHDNPVKIDDIEDKSKISKNDQNDETISISNDPKQLKNSTPILGVSNMFQSANYFSGADQTIIPPGSEMLFGQP